MLALVARLLEWLRSLFWKEEMELTLVGLQYSGKTTLLTVLASGQFTEDMIPTVGFNMRKITKGNVTIKDIQRITDSPNISPFPVPYIPTDGRTAQEKIEMSQ